MNNELLKDYESMFINLYRDFSSLCTQLDYINGKKSTLTELRENFIKDSIMNYKHHLNSLLKSIENNFNNQIMLEIKNQQTGLNHFNQLLNLLNINFQDLIRILEFNEEEVNNWFNLELGHHIKQKKIYNLYHFIITLKEVNQDKHNLLDLLTYSFINIYDDQTSVLDYVFFNFRDNTDREIAYEVIANYNKKKLFKGDLKLINIRRRVKNEK